MDTSLQISFFGCCKVSGEFCFSVRSEGHSCYTYVERAARRLVRWITVTAAEFRRAAVRVWRRSRVPVLPRKARVLAYAGGLRL